MLNVFGFPLELGVFFYIFFCSHFLVEVGFSNAVNLTDGIDGLGKYFRRDQLGAYAVIALEQKRFDLLIVIFSMIGGLLGFFGFNHKPAKIFYGRYWEVWLWEACWQLSLLPTSTKSGPFF